MKIIAFYLPQFHTFPENDEWWGKGFTEWVSVKNAKPLFKEHNQPRVPLDENYYDLTEIENLVWQAEIAKKYGVYGFCHYHYWFENKQLMQQPTELMLNNATVDIPFCLCWANHDWSRAWANKSREVLLKQTYGDCHEWERHFYYLLPFFKDNRYIKINEKPLFVIYMPQNIPCLKDMIDLWQKLASENGLNGISFAYQDLEYNHIKNKTSDIFDFGIEYQPNIAKKEEMVTLKYKVIRGLNKLADKFTFLQCKQTSMCLNYDKIWNRIINKIPIDDKMIPGAFVDWDNTPRHKNRGSLFLGVTPEKFKYYLSKQIKHAKEVYKNDMLFMFAWNEWGESGYLEPDKKNGYKMLEAVKEALEENEPIL